MRSTIEINYVMYATFICSLCVQNKFKKIYLPVSVMMLLPSAWLLSTPVKANIFVTLFRRLINFPLWENRLPSSGAWPGVWNVPALTLKMFFISVVTWDQVIYEAMEPFDFLIYTLQVCIILLMALLMALCRAVDALRAVHSALYRLLSMRRTVFCARRQWLVSRRVSIASRCEVVL